jgi:hypothetical protein
MGFVTAVGLLLLVELALVKPTRAECAHRRRRMSPQSIVVRGGTGRGGDAAQLYLHSEASSSERAPGFMPRAARFATSSIRRGDAGGMLSTSP